MKPIKFRAQTFHGKTVYGGYYCEKFSDIKTVHAIIDEGGEEFIVDPETIAQFVGYDRNGREVYEGDKILVDGVDDDEFFAVCLPVGVNHWGGIILRGGCFIFSKEFSLKEACQDPWNALQEIDSLKEKHFEEKNQ